MAISIGPSAFPPRRFHRLPRQRRRRVKAKKNNPAEFKCAQQNVPASTTPSSDLIFIELIYQFGIMAWISLGVRKALILERNEKKLKDKIFNLEMKTNDKIFDLEMKTNDKIFDLKMRR